MKYTLAITACIAVLFTSCSLAPPEERIIGIWNVTKTCNNGNCLEYPLPNDSTAQQIIQFFANGDYMVKTTYNGSTSTSMKGDFELYGDDMLDLYNSNYYCTTAFTIEEFTNDRLVLTIESVDGPGCGWHDEVHLKKL